MRYDDAKALLDRHGQDHVLRFWPRLDAGQKTRLLSQIETLDFDALAFMRKALTDKDTGTRTRGNIKPADVIALSGAEREDAVRRGADALRAGRVGVMLVAGGQGTRLGFDGPKGCFPLAAITGATLFQIHARKILRLERKYDTRVPFYVMTSEANDRATRDFFERNGYFGLSKDRTLFFTQGVWPALWEDGGIVVDRPDHIFMSPDGHGGALAALRKHGMLDDMEERGLETIFYFQVDNPLVEIADPAFIGLHAKRKADMSVKVCARRDPEEPIGVVVKRNGRDAVVEYTELTQEQKHAVLPDGRLEFQFGSVAIHAFSRDFLRAEADIAMPLHTAHKKVPYCDEAGGAIQPEKPNAYKFEKFIFDILPRARRTLNLEFIRAHEFSPVKNASGADSPDMARKDMTSKFAGWFEQCGIETPRDKAGDILYKIEIDPCFAGTPDELREKLSGNFQITGDVLLE